MYMLVRIGDYVMAHQASGIHISFLSHQLAQSLILVKRLFDKFIVSVYLHDIILKNTGVQPIFKNANKPKTYNQFHYFHVCLKYFLCDFMRVCVFFQKCATSYYGILRSSVDILYISGYYAYCHKWTLMLLWDVVPKFRRHQFYYNYNDLIRCFL